jgi:hypothetical protein
MLLDFPYFCLCLWDAQSDHIISFSQLVLSYVRITHTPGGFYTSRMCLLEGKLSKVPPDSLEEIKNKGKEQWNDLKPVTRSLIVQVFGLSEYPEYGAFITPSKAIEKFKARLTIMDTLQSKYLATS